MNEDKVRRAVEVANELVDWQKLPERLAETVWLRVFDMMVACEPSSINRADSKRADEFNNE